MESQEVELKLKYYNPKNENTTWMDHGNCVGVADIDDIFFDDTLTDRYKPYCFPCKIRLKCLLFAVKWDAMGIWGGTTDDMRRPIHDLPTNMRRQYIDMLMEGG